MRAGASTAEGELERRGEVAVGAFESCQEEEFDDGFAAGGEAGGTGAERGEGAGAEFFEEGVGDDETED